VGVADYWLLVLQISTLASINQTKKIHCIPVSDMASRRHLSARRDYLAVPRHSLSSYGRLAFLLLPA